MKPIASINVIPFIDIMLVILAIVLTTATFVAQGTIPIRLPNAESAEPLSAPAPIEITINQEGQIYINNENVPIDDLATQLDAIDAQTPLVLRIDQGAEFRYFVQVIDLLKERRLDKVSILTQRTQT